MLSIWSAQLLGAMGGAALMALHYAPALEAHARSSGQAGRLLHQRRGAQSAASTSSARSLGTAVLVWWPAPSSRMESRPTDPRRGHGAVAGGSLVWGIGLSLGGTTGYAINPARDLGPALVHWLLPIPGKGGSNWRYAPIPVIGPLIGGALAALLIQVRASLVSAPRSAYLDHDLAKPRRLAIPRSEDRGRLVHPDGVRDGIVHWKAPASSMRITSRKSSGCALRDPKDVQFLQHEQPGLVGNLLLPPS